MLQKGHRPTGDVILSLIALTTDLHTFASDETETRRKKISKRTTLITSDFEASQNEKFVNLNSAAAHTTDSFISFIKHQVKHLNRYKLNV